MPKVIDRPLPEAVAQGRMLSAREVMAYLGVSKQLLNQMTLKWQPAHRLPSYKIGKKRLYKLNEIDWWAEKHREPI